MERVTGIEPALPAWEAGVLPLNYTRASGRLGGLSERYGNTSKTAPRGYSKAAMPVSSRPRMSVWMSSVPS